ncbi:MAG: hypothetical protein N2648_00820, partial [Aquificaceae bacterium]|nr:hypothetical protein [Aquificaceae bacterium]
GCAKGCGQHGAGDLGFVGTKIKVNGQPKLAVEVFVGGRKVDTVPLEGLEHYVEKLVKEVLL